MSTMDEIIIEYCTFLGRPINRALLMDCANEFEQKISFLQYTLTHASPVDNDFIVYRYVDSIEASKIENAGQVYISPIFLSTSLISDINGYNGKRNCITLKVTKGTSGVFSDSITGLNESEFILPYGTKILIEQCFTANNVKNFIGIVLS